MNKTELQEFRSLIKKYLSETDGKLIPGKTKIPLAVPPFGTEEVLEALESMLARKTTMGDKVKKFEKKFADYVGSKYSLMVNSGSSANLLALSILSNPYLRDKRIKTGDEIITPAVTWATTVSPIVNIGAIPNFVDVGLNDFNIDADKIESAISKKTKAIMIVHLLGCPCDVHKIREIAQKNDLWLIEDSCEAHGARYKKQHVGSFGDISTFSFFASHHITTMEGGMIVTNNAELYDIGKSIRTFGWTRDMGKKKQIETSYPHIDPRFLFVNIGYNFRPTELQGAFGIHQIAKLDGLVDIRIKNAEYWNRVFSPLKKYIRTSQTKRGYKNSYLFYPITVVKNEYFTRDELVQYLEKHRIETRPIMTGNIVEQPVSKIIKFKTTGDLKNSQYIMRNSFAIGNHHEMNESVRKFIADIIIYFIDKKLKNKKPIIARRE
jgi:CDP-6-deoxy-D-xylo-4-hexulose-3-dehydrase